MKREKKADPDDQYLEEWFMMTGYLKYRNLWFLRAPFAFLQTMPKDIKHSIAKVENERRALGNVELSPHSLLLILQRIKNSMDGNQALELFIDVQSLFMFSEQFLQDVGLVIRLFLPATSRQNVSPKFHKQREGWAGKRLEELEMNEDFQRFLTEEAEWFNTWKDLRDDINHRTSFDKSRRVTFPSFEQFAHSALSGGPFIFSETDLKKCLSAFLNKLLFFGCLVEDYIKRKFINVRESYFVAHEAEAFAFHDKLFPNGGGAVTIGEEKVRLLNWWLNVDKEIVVNPG
jgi:hypothetical protein